MVNFTDTLRLEVETARNDAFVWGRSSWTGYRFGGPADTPSAGSEWANILGPTHNIKVHRGAKQDGAKVTVDAGSLTATVFDPLVDPSTNPYIKPGTPIRLMNNETPVFTGVLRQVRVTYRKTPLGERKPQVFLSAVDRVKDLANIMRYGALGNFYEDRVSDLLSRHGIPHTVGSRQPYVFLERNNYDSTILNHLNLATTSVEGQWFVDKQNIIRAETGLGAWLHTGYHNLFTNPRLFGTGTADDWLPHTVNVTGVTRTLTEVHANQYRQTVMPTTWNTGGQVGIYQVVKAKQDTGYTISADVTLSTQSSVYQARISAQRRNSGTNYGSAVTTTRDTNGRLVLSVPPAAGAFDEIAVYFWFERKSGSGGIGSSFTITKPLMQEGIWSGDPDATPLFTDQKAVNPNEFEYVDIGVTYDTDELINELTITNLTYDEDENGPKSVHTNWGPYKNQTSVATYGSYAQTIETNVPEHWLGTLASDVLNGTLEPTLHVSHLRLNYSENLAAAADLEIFDRITVEYSADDIHLNDEHVILSLDHEIVASNFEHSWLTNITLGGK